MAVTKIKTTDQNHRRRFLPQKLRIIEMSYKRMRHPKGLLAYATTREYVKIL
jgi:hypothetical protein